METRANYALIGAFTLAVVAAGFMFVFWFSAGSKTAALRTYQVIFSGSVSGLSRGAQVLFNGLRVGEVTDIDLMREDPSHVSALIEINQRTPVKEDTHAKLESQGLTGVASISLIGGSATSKPLERKKGAAHRVILADRSDLQNIIDNVKQISAKADDFLAKANKVLDQSSASITGTLHNAETMTKSLADALKTIDPKKIQATLDGINRVVATVDDNRASIDSLLKSAPKAADNIVRFTGRLDGLADQVAGVLDGAKGVVGSNATKGTIGDVGDAARSIKRLADNLDARTREITAGFNKIAGSGLRDLQGFMADSKRTLNDVNRTVRSINRNPQQFLLGQKSPIPEYSGN